MIKRIVADDATMAPWAKDFKIVSQSVCIDNANDIAENDYSDVKCNCARSENTPICFNIKCCNYAMQIECVKCSAHCMNQRIQKNEVADISVIAADKKGYGLFANVHLPQDTYIREYVGEIIGLDELLQRRLQLGSTDHLYAMEIKKETYIDSTRVGSISRFINHSCEPNCTAEVWVVRGKLRVAIVAMKPIAAGEELTFDYCWEPQDGRPLTKCYCGTSSCRGTIEITSGEYEESVFSKRSGEFRSSVDAMAAALLSSKDTSTFELPSEDASTSLPTSNINGDWLVGKRVRVWWEGNQSYFVGDVKEYNSITKKHKVHYLQDNSINEEMLWTSNPENPWMWLDETSSERGIGKRKGPKLSSLISPQTYSRPPIPSPVSPEFTSFTSASEYASIPMVLKVKSVSYLTELSAFYAAKIIPILLRHRETPGFEVSEDEKVSIFNACIQIATSEKECALGSFSNRSTPTSATRPDSPFTSFSPGNERCKDLYDAARQISSDVAVRIRDTTRDKIDAKYLIPSFEILDGSDMSMFQSLCFRCVRVSLFGVREDVDRIDRFLEVAVNDFSAACALWRSHHNSVIMHSQPLTMSRDWTVRFQKPMPTQESCGSVVSMSGYPTTKSLYLSLLQPEVSLTMPLRPDEVPAVREESKMSVTSTASPAVLSTESHINFKSSMTEQLYVKCIGHLRSICARMKLTLTVTLQAVSLLHRVLRVMSDSHVSANMIGMLSAIVSIALKSAGKYKLKYLHKICLITYCEIFDREEKNEIAKFGFQNSASSGGLYPAEDSLGQIYLSKLQIEECSILKAVGIDAAVVDLASSVVKLVDLGHEDSYFNNTSVLHAVHGVKPLDSNFHVASNADANTKLQSLLQNMHLFVITNAVTSTVARNEINHGDRSFSVRLDSLPEPLVALGSYALACALWDITADGSVETTSDSAFPFDLFPYRGRGFAECPPILHTLVAAYFKSSLYSLNDLFNAINTIQLCLTSTKRPSDGKVTTDMVQLSPGVSIHAIGGVRNDNWHGSLLWCNRETLNYSYQLVKHWLHVSNYPSPYAGQISKTDFESNTTSYRVRAHVTGIPKLGINKTGCFISGAAAINSIGDGMKTPVGELMQMKHSVSTMSSVAMFPLRTTNPNVADVAMTADVCSNHLSLPTSFHFYGKGNDEPLVSFDDACFGFGVTVGHAVMPSEKLCAISLSNADLDVSVNLKFSSSNKSHCETLPILHINSSLVHLRDNNDSLRLISTRRWPNARVQAAETLKRSSADRLKYAEEVSAGALSELAIIHRLHYLSDSGQSKHIFCPFGVISAVLPHISKAATPASSGNINNNINNKRERSPNSEELHGLPLSTYPTMVGESMDTVIVDDIDKPAVVKKKRRSFVVPARAQDASVAIDDSESNSALSSGHFDFNVNRNVIISSKQQSFDVTMELYELCGTDKQSKHNSMVYQYLVLPPICMSGADFHRAALHKKVHISSPGLCRLLCYDLMSAISYCSEKDVVFRYLSIDHVSITKEGRLIITDLSGACIIDFSAESGSAKAINHQIPPQYIHTSAPEVLLGGITSDSSSVYCFAQLAILLLLGHNVMRPIMENTRETLLTNIGEARANAIKKNGGDKYTHCQLQQLYRLLGTPKAVALTDFQSYPMGQVYCSKYIDGGNEIECRFRLPKIIGAYSADLLAAYTVGYASPSFSFEVSPEWRAIGCLDMLVYCMQLAPNLRPSTRQLIRNSEGLFASHFTLRCGVSSIIGSVSADLFLPGGDTPSSVRINVFRQLGFV